MKRTLTRLAALSLAALIFSAAPALAEEDVQSSATQNAGSGSGSFADAASSARPEDAYVGVQVDPDRVSEGDTLSFGYYEQNGDRQRLQEPIKWIVLEKKDGMFLLLSGSGLDTGAYNDEKVRADWSESSLRQWLNTDFLNMAFTPEEQESIIETAIVTPGGSFRSPVTKEKIKIAEAPDTKDKVFLLSVSEVQEYFPKASQRRSKNNGYLRGMPLDVKPYPAGNTKDDFRYGNWWLRDIRADKGINCGFHVKSDGSIASAGQINLVRYVIRPAIWVDQDALFYNEN